MYKSKIRQTLISVSVTLSLVSFTSACSEEQSSTPAAPQQIKSKRGESCSYTNDCESNLACVNSICIQDEYPVSPTAKTCIAIECRETSDCCGEFSDQTCPYECAQNRCNIQGFDVPSETCENDRDCVLAFCVDEICRDCRTTVDCYGGKVCSDNNCVDPCNDNSDCPNFYNCSENGECVYDGCERDSDCPIFSACEQNMCVHKGCQSDRECLLFTGLPSTVCIDAQCVEPCETNRECPDLNICVDNKCTFIGCETDTECRAFGFGALDTRNYSIGQDFMCVPLDDLNGFAPLNSSNQATMSANP